MQISLRPDESWLIYQAQSFLKSSNVTLEDAKELFKKIDITTRQPIPEAGPPRPSGLVAALRAMVSGGMVLVLVSGCVKESNVDNRVLNNVRKVYDKDQGIVCYVIDGSNGAAISCMVAKPGDNQ